MHIPSTIKLSQGLKPWKLEKEKEREREREREREKERYASGLVSPA